MTKSYLRRIRVRKEDSAYVYAILEASEGMALYSTLDQRPADLYRDLELIITESYLTEYEDWLKSLGDIVFAIPVENDGRSFVDRSSGVDSSFAQTDSDPVSES